MVLDLQKRGVLKNLDLSPLLDSNLKKHNSANTAAAAASTQNPESGEKQAGMTI